MSAEQAMSVTVDNIDIEMIGFRPGIEEIRAYIRHVAEHELVSVFDIQKITMELIGPESVKLNSVYKTQGFERIRRITGYLTGDISSWNDAKRAELADRVKHA